MRWIKLLFSKYSFLLFFSVSIILSITGCKKIDSVSSIKLSSDYYRIMGYGKTSKEALRKFLMINNPRLGKAFAGTIAELYMQEANAEGVNYDIAFCQMCHETDFLKYGNQVKASQNNFAGLGATDDGARGAIFKEPRIGVRAHIQHLKAYASTKKLVYPLVDPRFKLVKRGSALTIFNLTGKWASDRLYGEKLRSKLYQLYLLDKKT
jgi:hypothetical protein